MPTHNAYDLLGGNDTALLFRGRQAKVATFWPNSSVELLKREPTLRTLEKITVACFLVFYLTLPAKQRSGNCPVCARYHHFFRWWTKIDFHDDKWVNSWRFSISFDGWSSHSIDWPSTPWLITDRGIFVKINF